MSVKLNNINISKDFAGVIALGAAKKLYATSTDGKQYTLYGTLFRKERLPTVITPSKDQTFASGKTVENYLVKKISDRIEKSKDLNRLEITRQEALNGRYDYGVSSKLVDTLEYLSTNTVKPLPSLVLGGNLAYDDLEKTDEVLRPFENDWEDWSHVGMGLKRYDEELTPSLQTIDSVEASHGTIGVPSQIHPAADTEVFPASTFIEFEAVDYDLEP